MKRVLYLLVEFCLLNLLPDVKLRGKENNYIDVHQLEVSINIYKLSLVNIHICKSHRHYVLYIRLIPHSVTLALLRSFHFVSRAEEL